jgi:hypothetical protein
MIDASFSVITCSLLNIPQFVRHLRRKAASINIYSNGVKTTQHDQGLATPYTHDCDAESHKTTSTNVTQKSLSFLNTRDRNVKKEDPISTDTTGRSSLLSWNIVPVQSQSPNTGTTFVLVVEE